jgi:hypothetical protein
MSGLGTVGIKLIESGRNRFSASMSKVIVVMLSIALLGCGGMAGIHARRMSDSELKARLGEIERQQASYHAGEADAARLRQFEKLSNEESAVGRELLRRCRAGDEDACLPRFKMLRDLDVDM